MITVLVTCRILNLHLISNKTYFNKMCIVDINIALLFYCASSVWPALVHWTLKLNKTLLSEYANTRTEVCCAVRFEMKQIKMKLFFCVWLCSHCSRICLSDVLNLCVVSEDRIRNGCKKIMKSRQVSTQGRLDTFFTVTGSISSKRKVGCNDWN